MLVRTALASTALLFSLLTAPCYAQDAGRQAKVEQLFAAMHVQQTFDEMMTQLMDQNRDIAKSLFPEIDSSAREKAEFNDYMNRVEAVVKNSLSWNVLEPEYAKLYLGTYSAEEIDSMLAFYDSPAGKAMIAKTPQILQASSEIAQQHIGGITPKVRELMEEERAKLQSQQQGAK